MEPVGGQAVAIHWRDARFRKGRNLSVGEGGKLQRRHILMESPSVIEEDDVVDAEVPTLPSDPAVLRELADLEDARRDATTKKRQDCTATKD